MLETPPLRADIINFNAQCFQDNGSFLHPTKKADAHQIWKTRKRKTRLKLAWKNTERQIERECKKKNWNLQPENSIAYCWRSANLHMRQMSFVGKIDHLANVVLGWRITSHAVVLQRVHDSVDVACRLGYRVGKKPFSYSQNEVVDLKPLWSKKKKKKGEEGYRFVSYFVNEFVFLLFFFSRRRPNKQGV